MRVILGLGKAVSSVIIFVLRREDQGTPTHFSGVQGNLIFHEVVALPEMR